MSRKLALTFSGAVSLGSYEAGVLYEVLYALKQHNQQPGIGEDRKIYIDVLTGSSAGGLSIALAAQKLLYEADSLDDPYHNPFYDAWVTDLDIDDLLTFAPDESPASSILSSDFINNIARKYLLARYADSPVVPPKAHAALSPDATIRLGLSLSNLSGVDYSHPTLASGSFTYTRFQDQLTQTLGLADDSQAAWESVMKAAVACGAFPFAFRVEDLDRGVDCYNSSPFFDPSCFGGRATRPFTYTDGGVFQNEPLGLAKNLADSVDRHLDSDKRAYLFVSPDPKRSTADDAFTANMGTFVKVAARLLSAIFNQARFQDWIAVENVNRQVVEFNSLAMALHESIAAGALGVETLQPLLTPLLVQFLSQENLSQPNQEITAARLRLKHQFAQEYKRLADVRGPLADMWIDSILIFETTARLQRKDEMYIYALTATQQELAGSPLLAFLGFFDRDYRDHDYDIGRIKAQAFLRNPGTPQQGPLSAVNYTPLPVRPLKPGLTGATIQNVSIEKRRQVRDRLKNRVGIILKEAGLSFLVRYGLQLVFLNGKIDAFLGL